jgi:hypothetical protein
MLFMPSLSRQCLRLGDNLGGTPSFHAREGFTSLRVLIPPKPKWKINLPKDAIARG